MPARSVGTGTVSFGLVSIPVRLYSTSETSGGVRFNMLDPSDNTRVKQQLVNPRTGVVVERKETIKGYEFGKGQYVTFSDEEIKELQEKASPAIEITEFVPLAEVEPIYFEKSYYLGPEKGGERAYRLLSEAMRKTGRSALAKHAARGKQYLVMLRPFASGLLMQQLKYEDELKSFDEVPLGEETELKPGELELAMQLIEQIASDEFKPDQYTDDVRKRLWDAIQSKIDGRELADDETEAPQAQIIDLMEALKASLSKNGEEEATAADSKPPKKAAAQRKATKKKRVRRAASTPAKRAVAG
ncbi:MAG: Ku protein [Acidobacteriota bacterium]|nr:Ku protein [Acidobacteriota bacterium]MDE2922862.1 Ku protein [Acidobacteriota bacterium]MDE3263418.1 Ku protein [Acidobacteriota bacterium]